MSVENFIFLADERLPSIDTWQAALDREGTEIVLHKIDDLREHTGYIPATHRGHESGFEWFYGPIGENFGDDLPDGVGDRTHVIDFVTHSDMRELVCGLIAGAVLAKISDGVVFDEESGEVISGDAALQAARDEEKHLG
jgi:hypothetical protein